jgi:5'-3' exonuclease
VEVEAFNAWRWPGADGPEDQHDPKRRGRPRQVWSRSSGHSRFPALVGDNADGYPGIEGIGKATAARLVARYGPIEDFPAAVLDDERRQRALLFKKLATLRMDAALIANVDELKWQGPKDSFAQFAARASDERVLTRARKAAGR